MEETSDLVLDFYQSMSDRINTHSLYKGKMLWSLMVSYVDSERLSVRVFGHFRTLIRKCPQCKIPRLIQAVNAVHPICIKNQYENNNILGLDTSE